MSGFIWSNENVFKLIRLFQERELLWNTQIDEYKDRTKKHEAWIQIANEFNLDKQSIEKKIRSLIGQFQRECKKSKSGAGADDVTKWFAYKKLLFLKERNKPEEIVNIGLSDIDEESHGNFEATSPMSETVDINEFARSSTSQLPASPVCEAPVRKRKLDIINEAINKLYKISSIMNEELDEFDHFGKFVTAQLRKMPEYEAILCQEELHSVIRKYRLRPLTVSLNNTRVSPSGRSPSTPPPTQIYIKNEM